MKKNHYIFIVALLLAFAGVARIMTALAGDRVDIGQGIVFTSVSQGAYTQAVDSVTDTLPTQRFLEGFYVYPYGSPGTCSIHFITVATNGIYSGGRTLLTNAAVTAEGMYQVRVPVVSTTGGQFSTNFVTRIPLGADRVRYKAWNSTGTNLNLRITPIYVE